MDIVNKTVVVCIGIEQCIMDNVCNPVCYVDDDSISSPTILVA